MRVKLAETDAEIEHCFPVMVQLRPHLTLATFLKRIHIQRKEGYQLAFVEDEERITAVAGFRIMEMLAHARTLYVDDLVTDEASRSKVMATR